jgi:hypothetical protein
MIKSNAFLTLSRINRNLIGRNRAKHSDDSYQRPTTVTLPLSTVEIDTMANTSLRILVGAVAAVALVGSLFTFPSREVRSVQVDGNAKGVVLPRQVRLTFAQSYAPTDCGGTNQCVDLRDG